MKCIKLFLIGIVFFLGASLINISAVRAQCLSGAAGFNDPNCSSNSSSTPTPSPANYPSSSSGCTSYCQNTTPQWNSYNSSKYSDCTNRCTASFAPKVDYNTCVSKCNNTSSADKSSCINSCSSTSTPSTPTPTVTSAPTPTPTENANNDYFKPVDSSQFKCGGIISDRLLNEFVKIYKTVGMIMVVAVIIFGMLDFFKAVSAGDADTMKKVTKRFTNRLIIAILIATLPIVLELILSLFGNESMKTCLDQFK